LMVGRTSLVIAQRISTVLNADQILVLDKGQAVAQGTHAELMDSSPLYADIYYSQLYGDGDLPLDESEPAALAEVHR
jgi:ATP-binding cassette subfamily B multidrug efflux pump